MTERIIIAGSGGQGIMLLGKILAEAGMRENKYVTWLPSYGAEVRGGTAHCAVIISDAEIGSPYINKADALIIMNQPSWNKFKNRIKNKGLSLVNSSLVLKSADRNAHISRHPFSDIAAKLGNIRVANVVALGCFITKKKIVGLKSIQKSILGLAGEGKKELVEINMRALEEGMKLR
ncbi:MAG: 2-oxoacid:acceptor oxidoreductase family protein [Candidatus Omnitrophica bacterium]|nr:2-oxoacid:acceptor oxidoreductase family protein [Candidatus Omnitrophota bacterium]MDD5238352.1 2-oxoacid:acceptor oxidoreductase family protein [Candidatus Omnitrophota bacterium]